MIGYVKHLQPTEFVWSGTFGCSACARKIDYTAIYVIKFYSFIYIDINSAKDLDFYEMFSGCGSLYQEFRPVLSDIYTIHVYYQQLNIYIYINLGKNGMAALGPKWLTVFLYILMFIYIYQIVAAGSGMISFRGAIAMTWRQWLAWSLQCVIRYEFGKEVWCMVDIHAMGV